MIEKILIEITFEVVRINPILLKYSINRKVQTLNLYIQFLRPLICG